MNFDDTAKFFGPTRLSAPVGKGKWKVKPWSWWPESAVERISSLVWPNSAEGIKLCSDCKRIALAGKHRFCEKCALDRRRNSNSAAMRRKRRSRCEKKSPF